MEGMAVQVMCEQFPLEITQVQALLDDARVRVNGDARGTVLVQCVSQEDIRHMNYAYRQVDKPTNVLTFSYDEDEHDVALCMDIAKEEAGVRNMAEKDYVALLLTHSFLHVLGMDHEESANEHKKTQELEQQILQSVGFTSASLAPL